MLTPNLSKQSEKFLRRLQQGQPKHASQIAVKIKSLSTDPLSQDSIKLKGYDYRRVYIGEYRIIYTFNTETLFITVIGKRNDDEVYKLLLGKD